MCIHCPNRQCQIVAPCCQKVYDCVICHNLASTKQNHKESKDLIINCQTILTKERIAQGQCRQCSARVELCGSVLCPVCGVQFDERWCEKCMALRGFDSRHCDLCGYCIIGEAVHCDKCERCVSSSVSTHLCPPFPLERCALDHGDDGGYHVLDLRRDQVRLICGHTACIECLKVALDTDTPLVCLSCLENLGQKDYCVLVRDNSVIPWSIDYVLRTSGCPFCPEQLPWKQNFLGPPICPTCQHLFLSYEQCLRPMLTFVPHE
jgi:hypothetical protein